MGSLRLLLFVGFLLVQLAPTASAQCEPSCILGLVAVGVTQSSHGPIAVSGTGSADGELAAMSLARNAEADMLAVSVLAQSPGNSEAGMLAISGTGNAEGELAALTLTGNSDGFVAVSATGHAQGTIAVGGGDL